MATSHDSLAAPIASRGKRSRSNSTSSSTSSSTASSTGASVLSRFASSESIDSLSSCSSPASNETSPYFSGPEDSRPCKSAKTNSSLDATWSLAALGLGNQSNILEAVKPVSAPCGKTFFVDCLVDAAVRVLNIIWEAPLDRTIAFVCNDATDATSVFEQDASKSCKCPHRPRPMEPIPLDLFVRETLRRSRTSCSTLQAALLFCKRAGGDVIRKRAEKEGITLSSGDLARLPGADDSYLSLTSAEGTAASTDFILCPRRSFLASVMISSKFLQDRTFSNRAWSKISGLEVKELSNVERRLLVALGFNLSVREDVWQSWTEFLKGDRRVGQPTARCGLQHSFSQPQVQRPARSSISRTYSLAEGTTLHDEEKVDADVCLPSGDEHAFFSSGITGYATANESDLDADTDSSTPKCEGDRSGQSTPTTTKVVRAATSDHRRSGSQTLLATAVHNNMQLCNV